MSTLKIDLPDDLNAFVNSHAATRGYSSTGAYLTDMISKQRDLEQLREKLEQGACSGPGKILDDAWFTDLRKRATR